MKKYLFIVTLLIAFCVPWAHGQTTLTINEGTATNKFVPLYGYYADMTSYEQTQFIIPQEQLTSVAGSSITNLKFYANYSQDFGAANWNIYIGETSQTTILSSIVNLSDCELVYSGHLAISSNELDIPLNCEYAYGGGNLVVVFHKTYPGTCSPSSSNQFYGVSADVGASGYSTSGAYTAASFLPKLTITYAAAVTCKSVQSVSVANVERCSFDVTWTPKACVTNCEGYEVVVSDTELDATALESATKHTVTDGSNTYHAVELERNTQYYIYVRSNCGEEAGYSEWISTEAMTKSLLSCADIIIANGTTIHSNTPLNFYTTDGETLHKAQFLYPASLLAENGVSGTIKGVTFYDHSGATRNLTTTAWTIKVGTTTATDLSAGFCPDELTTVYSGNYLISAGVVSFAFDNDFDYTGGNLVVEISCTGASGNWYGSNGGTGYYGVDGIGSTYSTQTNYTSFLPKTTFDCCNLLDACPAVTNVTVSDIAQTTANLSWTASEGDYANTYDVLVSTTPVEDFTGVVPTYTGLDTCGQELTLLTQYTDYYVYVRVNCDARGHDEGEAWSEAVQFKTLPNCITPADFTVTVLTKTSAKAQWTATSQTSNYRYILSTTEVENPDVVTPDSTGMTGDTILLDGLTPGQDYYLYISNDCGGSDGYSPYISFEFTMPETCIVPTEMNISDIQKYQMTLNWTPSQYAEDGDAYDIYVSTAEVLDFTGIEPTYASVTGTSKVIDLLQRNTTYYVYLRGNCGEGAVTDWSEAVSKKTLDIAPDCDNLQTIAVGDGSSSSTKVPANTYYMYAISEQIYTASEIGRAGTIKSISFYCTQNGGYYRNFTVYLAHTSKSVFSSGTDWVTVSASDAVYSGNCYIASGAWNTITFTTPFEYNGTDNLLVVIDDNSGNYQGTSASYRTHTADGNKTLYLNTDDTNVNPTASSISTSGTTSDTRNDMQFGFCGAAPACPAVDAPVATDVTNNSATISWNAGTGDFATSYDLVISDTAVTDFEGVTLAADDMTETSFNAVGLAANTHYYTYVRVNCVNEIYDDGSSVWSPAGEFTTEFPCLKPENFVAGSPLSDRVELSWIKRGTAVDWRIYVDTFDVEYTAWLPADTVFVNAADCQIAEDTVTYLLTGLQPEKTYTLALLADCGEVDSLSKFALNTPSFTTLSNNTEIDTMNISSAEVIGCAIDREAKTVDFVVRKGSDLEEMYGNIVPEHWVAQIRVNGEDFIQPWNLSAPVTVTVIAQDTNVTADWTITVVEEPCATPFNVAATDVERRTANITWNIGDPTTSFDFVISETELEDPATGTIQNITATNVEGACTYAITGMTRGTHYYVYVRTNCGETYGQWRGTDFTTKSITVCSEETIADGTVIDVRFPFYGYYQDTPGTKSQFIYGSDMLTELRGKSISKMTFYNTSASQSFGTNRVSIGITSDNSFSGAFKDSPSQVVFTGQVSVSDYQHTIEFDAPFKYPAEGGNLLIEYDLTSSGDCPHTYFYGINTSSNTGRCRTSDATFLPKVTFEVCDITDACPEVTDVAIDNIGETSATVTWTESTGDYANASDIYYSTNPDTTGVIAPMVTGVTGNSAEITGLANYTIYYVWVRTHCDGEGQNDGISNWAGGTSFRTLAPCRVPGTPEATVTGKHTATVAWTNTSDGTQTDNFTYIVSPTPIAEADLETAEATASAYNNTTVDLTGLLSETTYYFYVKNVCTGNVNCSSPWDSCQFTMPVAMPAVINLRAFDIASNAFSAVWESDLANFADETAWEVACVPAGEIPASWTEVSAPEHFALGLTPLTSYDFYVRAKDGENYSANAMVSVTTTAVPADCKTIGDGTERQNNIPCANYYNYGYSQQIFDASELQAGQITDIAFQYGTTTAMTGTDVKIYLGHTSKSEFTSETDWIAAADLTEVYSGPFYCSGNEVFNTFTLTTPFNYNGTDNLVVAVHKENYGYEGQYHYFTYSSCSGSKTLYYQNDYTDCPVASPVSGSLGSYRNNIEFCFTPQACRPVTNLVVDNITATSARAHWYPGAAETEWHVYNSTEQMTANDLALLEATDYTTLVNPQIALTGLTKDMDYYFYVRGNCGEGETSRWKEIHYITLPSCSAPATAVATSEADNSITFTVTSGEYGTEGTYDYRYWIVGSDDTTTVAGQTSELTVNDLASSVYYAWEVRANCSGEDEGASRWVAGNDVHVCGAVTLPYSEGFETVPMTYSGPGMIEPICWNDLNASANSSAFPYYHGSLSFVTEGHQTLQFQSSNVTPIYMIMPPIKDATECQVKFDCAIENIDCSGRFQVGYMTDPADATTFVPAFTDSPTSVYVMQTHTVNIFNIPEGARIAFCYTAGSIPNYYGWLDNVLVDTIPYYTVATSVAPEVTPAIGSVEIAYNEGDTLSEGVFFGGSAPVFTAIPNVEGIEFTNWTNANNGDTLSIANPWTINIAQDTAIVANFDTASFNLNVMVAPGHDLYGDVAGSGSYRYGRTVNYSATPMAHYSVVWSDGNKENNRSIVMPAHDTTIVATFEIDKHQLTVAMNDSSKGTVTGTGVYDYGTFVDITAAPIDPEHIIFTGWSNGETNPNITIDLQCDSTVTANFIWDSHTVATYVNDESMGSVTGAGTYTHGDVASLTAIPADHYQFVDWSSGSTENPLTFTVEKDTTLTANFVIARHAVSLNVNNPTIGTVSGAGTYDYGASVTVTATPQNDHVFFARWSDGATANPYTFTLTNDTAITAMFVEDRRIVIAGVNDHNLGSVSGAGAYYLNTEVTLTATPADGHSIFTGWSNGATANPYTFILTNDTAITAMFTADQHTIAANVNNPAMGTVAGAGAYAHGALATLTATPSAHHHLVNWSNGLTANTFSILVDKDSTVTANFAVDQHNVSAIVNDQTMGSVTGTGMYNYGSNAIITAVPAANHHFVSWNTGGTNVSETVNVTGDVTLVATFAVNRFNVVANTNDANLGIVSGSGSYDYGTQVTLTAAPNNAGIAFAGWSDGTTANPYTFTLTGDVNITGNFVRNNYNVTLNVNDDNMGSVEGAGTYAYGDAAVIKAIPADDCHSFVRWSDGETAAARTIIVDNNVTLTATFAIDQYTVRVASNDKAGGMAYCDESGSHVASMKVACGTVVDIYAEENQYYRFVEWSDGIADATRSVAVDGDIDLVAVFEPRCGEYGDLPVVFLYNGLVMLDLDSLNERAYNPGPDQVRWYQVIAGVDNIDEAFPADDKFICDGYYLSLPTNNVGYGQYYAVVDVSNSPAGMCNDKMKSVVVEYTPEAAREIKVEMAPTHVKDGDVMTVTGLRPEERTTITVCDYTGRVIEVLQTEGLDTYDITAHGVAGVYMVKVTSASVNETFKFIVTK